MRKFIFALMLLSTLAFTFDSCTRARPGCKKNAKKVKKLRKSGHIKM